MKETTEDSRLNEIRELTQQVKAATAERDALSGRDFALQRQIQIVRMEGEETRLAELQKELKTTQIRLRELDAAIPKAAGRLERFKAQYADRLAGEKRASLQANAERLERVVDQLLAQL